MQQNQYALHETVDLHEMAVFKTTSLTKSKTMQMLVSDPELKQLMQQDVKMTTRQLEEIQQLLSKANV
ncbi:hypothetical protein [Marinicrinis lubricantis]|uniref:Spore coat protein n=1 Tax=Marinicrinis lubricantis TaxID=2086470 RepID=A0ABW1IPA0_9BACL